MGAGKPELKSARIARTAGSNVDYGAAAAIIRWVAGRDDTAKVNARTAGAGQDIEDERHDGNDQSAEKGGAETGDGKVRSEEPAGEFEQEGVDEENEKTEGEDNQRE